MSSFTVSEVPVSKREKQASLTSHLETVKLLIEKGVDVDKEDKVNNT